VVVIGLVISLALLSSASGQTPGFVYGAPAGVATDCSVDVTQPLLTWIASVPNNATLSFAPGGCYRIEGTLELRNRSALTFEGNGATFRSFSAPADQRAVWRVIDSTNIAFHDMTVKGSYANGGTFNASIQHAHAIDVRGTSVDIGNVTMTDVGGDCVYLGLGYSSALTRSSGSVHDSSCMGTGRNAVSVTAGDNIVVQRMTTDKVGFTVFDVEPNVGTGWGSQNVTFDSNTIGSYYLYAYAVVENAPTSNQSFTNNHVSGQGLRIGVVHPGADYRPANVTITGNSSDTAQWAPAMEIQTVDGLTVTGNTVPMSNGAMATVAGSCNLVVASNSYPGGASQVSTTPWLCSMSPGSGSGGSTVTLTGSGLTGARAVSFNGVNASFAVGSDSQVTATVPSSATSGAITVTTAAGTASTASPFTVTSWQPPTPAVPTITSFSPAGGAPGTAVTITGSGFTGASAVAFAGAPSTFTVSSDTLAVATVPAGAASGAITLTTPGGTASSSTAFTVSAPSTPPPPPPATTPSIGSFTPTSGPVGSRVTVSGANFTGASAVSIAGAAASFTVDSDSQITLTVPAGAANGPVTVTTPAGSGTSARRFRATKH